MPDDKTPFGFKEIPDAAFHKHGKYEIAISDVNGTPDAIRIQWIWRGGGFGSLAFYLKDGRLFCDDEAMNDEFVEAVLLALAKSATRVE